jgi:DNA-binding transcriptional LysR family regulator
MRSSSSAMAMAMAIDPRLLRSFVVLAEELHFGRSAERLNIAQPGLSQQIRRLEVQVGSPLFTRDSRAVELTDAGRAMLEPARAALRAVEQAESAAREAVRIARHPLRVGVAFDLEDIVAVVGSYAAKHSDVQLWIARMYESQGHVMLTAGLIDAFVGLAPPEDSGITRKRAIDIPLFALLGLHHPLATRSAVPLETYRQSPIAILARDHAPEQFDYYVEALSEGAGRQALSLREFRPSGTGSNSDIVEEVAAGHAVGFGSPATLAVRARHLRLLPFETPLFIPTYMSWKRERSTIVDTFVAHMSGGSSAG